MYCKQSGKKNGTKKSLNQCQKISYQKNTVKIKWLENDIVTGIWYRKKSQNRSLKNLLLNKFWSQSWRKFVTEKSLGACLGESLVLKKILEPVSFRVFVLSHTDARFTSKLYGVESSDRSSRSIGTEQCNATVWQQSSRFANAASLKLKEQNLLGAYPCPRGLCWKKYSHVVLKSKQRSMSKIW